MDTLAARLGGFDSAFLPGRRVRAVGLGEISQAVRLFNLGGRVSATAPGNVYEDIGELDPGLRAGLKALYSDARKRAAVAAGIGAYLYTALEPVVLPIGPKERQVQVIRRPGKADVLSLFEATEEWFRRGYQRRVTREAVRRDLGEILAHGEPERGMGQGEAAEQPPEAEGGEPVKAATDAVERRAP